MDAAGRKCTCADSSNLIRILSYRDRTPEEWLSLGTSASEMVEAGRKWTRTGGGDGTQPGAHDFAGLEQRSWCSVEVRSPVR